MPTNIRTVIRYWNKLVNKSWDWFESCADTVYARSALAFASFIDSWLFFFPPEILLVTMTAAKPKQWFQFATITTVFALLGGLVGYAVGAFFFEGIGEHIIASLGAENEFARAQEAFLNNAFLVMFLASFTPVPYVPFVLASGFFGVNLFVVLAASLVGRVLRFYLIAYVSKTFGKPILSVLTRYAHIATFIIIVLAVLYLILQ